MNKEFMSGVVFELEKDIAFQGMREFKWKIYRKYGFVPDGDLYRRIVNYQIETYGRTFNNYKRRDYVQDFGRRNSKRRLQVKENNQKYYALEKVVERND